MSEKVCQSCGMPMTANEHFGTNNDGGVNEKYCVYCMKDGSFTSNQTLDEMIEEYASNPEFLKDEDGNTITKEAFIAKTKPFLSTLERWKNN